MSVTEKRIRRLEDANGGVASAREYLAQLEELNGEPFTEEERRDILEQGPMTHEQALRVLK